MLNVIKKKEIEKCNKKNILVVNSIIIKIVIENFIN